jgi:hypothetical protein
MTTYGVDGGAIIPDVVLDLWESGHTSEVDQDCYLPLNVITRTQTNRAIHLSALIGKQVLSILVDSGISHTFLNASMLPRIQITPLPTKPMKVKVANGQYITSAVEIRGLQWWI